MSVSLSAAVVRLTGQPKVHKYTTVTAQFGFLNSVFIQKQKDSPTVSCKDSIGNTVTDVNYLQQQDLYYMPFKHKLEEVKILGKMTSPLNPRYKELEALEKTSHLLWIYKLLLFLANREVPFKSNPNSSRFGTTLKENTKQKQNQKQSQNKDHFTNVMSSLIPEITAHGFRMASRRWQFHDSML